MSKLIMVILDSIPKFNIKVTPTTTISDIKNTIKVFFQQHNLVVNRYSFQFNINSKTQLPVMYTRQYDAMSLKSVFKEIDQGQIIIFRQTGYQDLPKDIKKLLIEQVEPLQVVELCRELKCDWQKLLNINYDFVTQGFAVGKNPKEKFQYLAKRVSRNTDVDNPETIFIHLEGKPMGNERFLEFSFNPEEDDVEELEDLQLLSKEKWTAIVETLKESSAVEWVRYDKNNAWIKVLDRNELPTDFLGRGEASGGMRHRVIYRDMHTYDYPDERKQILINRNIEYPGVISRDVPNLIPKLEHEFELDEALDTSTMTKEQMLDQDMLEYELELDSRNASHEYNVYQVMTDLNLNRSEAEVVTNILETYKGLNPTDSFSEKYKKHSKR